MSHVDGLCALDFVLVVAASIFALAFACGAFLVAALGVLLGCHAEYEVGSVIRQANYLPVFVLASGSSKYVLLARLAEADECFPVRFWQCGAWCLRAEARGACDVGDDSTLTV